MSVHQCRKTKRWYVKYRVEGKQTSRWFGTGKTEKQAAGAFDFDIKAMKKRREDLPRRSGVFLDYISQAYLNDAKMRGASQSFLDEFSNLLNKFFLPVLTKKPADELDYADILCAMTPFIERSQATRNRYQGYLRAIFRFGINQGLIKKNPLQNWRKPKEAPRRPLLTVDGLREIMKHAPEHLRWAIELEWNLGARPGPSELFSLKWEHVNFEENTILIYARKTKTWRETPISPDFIKKLKECKERNSSDFIIEYLGNPVKRLSTSWNNAVKKAKLPYQCTFYDIRHLFATSLLNQGADLAAVSALLGHHSIYMTANQYYHLMAGEKRNAVKKLPSLDLPGRNVAKVLAFKEMAAVVN
ncbi:MAG: tyrosine-type recombinase/integrase [Desulfovibrio sp.]|jgi:integrase|nr:tyrosine-type recombinase/integrase [Desulfovibrio sp.]